MKKITIPKEIRINVGPDCDSNCIGCSKQGPKDQKGKFLELSDYVKLIEELKSYGQTSAISLTGGEPLYPKLIATTIELIKKSKPWDVRLCTNGHFIDRGTANKLKKIGVNSVQIGFDSATKEFQDRRARSKSAWDMTVRGIKNAAAAGLDVWTRFTLYKENLNEVLPAYKLAESLGVAQFKLRILFPVGGCVKNCLAQIPSGRQLADAQYGALLISKGNKARLELSQPCFFKIPAGCNAFIENNSSCGELNNGSINAHGLVEYCLFCEDGEVFGNIKNNGFIDLWNSPEIEVFRKSKKRKGKIVGCPAFEFQYNKYLSHYRNIFERDLVKRTQELQINLR